MAFFDKSLQSPVDITAFICLGNTAAPGPKQLYLYREGHLMCDLVRTTKHSITLEKLPEEQIQPRKYSTCQSETYLPMLMSPVFVAEPSPIQSVLMSTPHLVR